ncbi:hypothetical protein AF332_12015 [Sporosarcina globispora]|uniref:dihydrofolate reductase n=1 Tax=Sporosarcina globispora TaxID=1459 RepID=A0A0M0GDI3_SPOGL|nr:dihydrofolate reductase [Sporosarcina globispora]KON87481.1 hypothetical protein AF332_12015 [Sporosarcina globispora]
MSINIIAAMGLDRELGQNNQLLCNLSADLKHFKELTTGGFVLMGSNTFRSIGKSLPDRENIVLTRDTKHNLPADVFAYDSFDQVLFEYRNFNEEVDDLWIIGGSNVYSQAIQHADKMYLTVIQNRFPEADCYFPAFDLSDWNHKVTGFKRKDEKNDFDHYYVEYSRKDKIK